MKKYLIIGYDGYYPKGGLDNIVAHTDNEKRAYKLAELMKERGMYDFCYVIDRDTFVPSKSIYRSAEIKELIEMAKELTD